MNCMVYVIVKQATDLYRMVIEYAQLISAMWLVRLGMLWNTRFGYLPPIG